MPKRELDDYETGYIDGLTDYAHMIDGVYWVGTTGKSLRRATLDFLVERGAR